MTEFYGCVSNTEDELGQRLIDIWDEVVELAEVKSWDEFMDVVFGFVQSSTCLYGATKDMYTKWRQGCGIMDVLGVRGICSRGSAVQYELNRGLYICIFYC